MIQSLRHCTALLIALCAALLATRIAHAAPPAPEVFFRNASFSDAKLSPNGRFVAMRVAAKGARVGLAVLDVSDMSVKPVASFSDSDVGRVEWVNDTRLVFSLIDLQIGQGDVRTGPGLFAVNRDGSGYRQLVQRAGAFFRTSTIGDDLLPWNTRLVGPAPSQVSDEVYVIQPERYSKDSVEHVSLHRLNTVNGRAKPLEDVPQNLAGGLLDRNGTPRVAKTVDGQMVALHYNDPDKREWRKLLEYHRFTGKRVDPLHFSADGKLYVRASDGSDTSTVHLYDLAANKLGERIVTLAPGYDFAGSIVHDSEKVLGVRYMIDAEVTQWFDPKMQDIQKTVDAILPDTINRIAVASRAETPYVLVTAFSDVLPEVYLLYNTATKKLAKLGASRADVDPKQMSVKDFVRYKARDGLEIPAYLTLPANGGKKDLPLVVLVHGGPYVRGATWNWDAEVQFLASRGYAVLQPEFRGSTGFGWKHFQSGWKQWGLAMQNDIADGAKWAIAQGIADPKRICLAGASYGGYATLMGLINDPDLFRCGVEWVGVTDINLLYTARWSDTSDILKDYGLPVLVGDPEADAAQMKSTSPLHNAARIKQPLLLAYGGADRRVPIVHGEKFFDAVKAVNKDVEWVIYKDEGHGWALPATRVDFWTRVEKFLERNIGKP